MRERLVAYGWDGRTTTGWRYEGCDRAYFPGDNTVLSVSTRRARSLACEVRKKAVQEERKDQDLGAMISITLMTYRCSKQKHFMASLPVRLVKTHRLEAHNLCSVHLVLCAKVIVLVRVLLVFSQTPNTSKKDACQAHPPCYLHPQKERFEESRASSSTLSPSWIEHDTSRFSD